MMTVPKHLSAGFTLMEILVSISIIAIVLVSLFRVQSGSMDLTGAGRFRNTARMLAKKQLALVEKSMDEKLQEQGRFDPPFENFVWQCRISDMDFSGVADIPEKEAGKLKKIELEVKQDNRNRTYDVKTFRYVGEE